MKPSLLPARRTAPTQQSTLTAVELSLKDGARAFSLHAQLCAQWLVRDVGPRLAQRMGPLGPGGRLQPLHGLVESAARQTLTQLEAVQHRVAATALADERMRALDFTLLPLQDYLAGNDARNPSGLFADVFYWLIRHALALLNEPHGRWLVQQRLVDEAWWRLQRALQAAAPPSTAAAGPGSGQAPPGQPPLALQCALLLRALQAAQPIREATLAPWLAAHDAPAAGMAQPAGAAGSMGPVGVGQAATATAAGSAVPAGAAGGTTAAAATESSAGSAGSLGTALPVMLAVVLAVASVPLHGQGDAAACLHLGQTIAAARLTAFEAALLHPSPQDALAAEFAFVLRHLDPCN